jgi:predicted double-glycine peptidase
MIQRRTEYLIYKEVITKNELEEIKGDKTVTVTKDKEVTILDHTYIHYIILIDGLGYNVYVEDN